MDTVYPRCAGLDVHQRSVEATIRVWEDGQTRSQTRRFGTMTRDLLALSDWLQSEGVTHAAMESTGVFWKPIYNILEGLFEVLLVNAQHVKQVPGRKTDVKDSQWLAQLLQHGLLRGRLIPPRQIRELRDLTRQRSQMVSEQTRIANRLQKTLEDANIKLAAVASDILGVSGRSMLEALAAGEEDSQALAELARGRLRGKICELQGAMQGRMTDHHRFLLKFHWDHLTQIERLIAELDQRIEDLTGPFEEAIARLDEVPGIDRRVAEVLLAEIGADMTVFPTADHLASWAGMSPGNHESAGKRKTGRTTKGSRWLRQTLVQAAWAAARTKQSYYSAQFARIAKRRGRQRALVAVGHSILIVVYHLLRDPERSYQDLGADFLLSIDPMRLTRYHVKQLEKLGHSVALSKPAA